MRTACTYDAADVPRKGSQQLLSELLADDDGLRCKPIGIWSVWKLAALHLYFSAFATACKSVGGGFYVDGFAGPGVGRVRNSKPDYFAWGSPLLAMRCEPPFQQCLFIELNESNCDTLRQRVGALGGTAQVHQGDVNRIAADLIASEVPNWAPCFCLLDQQGGELDWMTVEAIAGVPGRRRKPELMILFPLRMALVRLLSIAGDIDPKSVARWNSTLGTTAWRAIYEGRVRGEISPSDAQRKYLELFESRLKELGYAHVTSKVISAPRAAGRVRQEMYHLVFATDSDTGFRIMSHVFERPYSLDFPVTQKPPLFE